MLAGCGFVLGGGRVSWNILVSCLRNLVASTHLMILMKFDFWGPTFRVTMVDYELTFELDYLTVIVTSIDYCRTMVDNT